MSIKPDWIEKEKSMDPGLSSEELHFNWSSECSNWLASIARHYGEGYQVFETKNFLILSNESDRYTKLFSEFLERTLKRILNTLNGIASDEGYGKHAALIFNDMDKYYEYVSMFLPEEGEFGLSSGMYINDGYGHFVFPTQDINFAETISVHELTHACLSHLPIPLWLNEGLAVLMEEALAGNQLFLDKEMVSRHQNYWDANTIQSFWSGDSFFAADEGQELSYNLAHVLVRNISQNYEAFKGFCNSASFEDAGNKASQEYIGVSLEQIVGAFLGQGDWKPVKELNKRQQPARSGPWTNNSLPFIFGRCGGRYIWR